MKKSIILVAMLAIVTCANAQWFDFSNNSNRYGVGVNLGVVGLNTEFTGFGFGVSLTAWGVYADFLTAGPMYKYDNRVASMNDPYNVRFLPDSTVATFNLGYQIPVLPWLRIMPLIGFTVNSSGHTDMATHSAQTSGSGDNITVELYHDYNREYSWTYLNFGGGIIVTPIKWFSVYGVYTKEAIYGGISFNLNALVEE